MNVIKVQRPPRRRSNTQIHPERVTKSRIPNEFGWQAMAEIFLFGMISLISIWPVFDAMDAVLRLK
jgi:hypothetical protein